MDSKKVVVEDEIFDATLLKETSKDKFLYLERRNELLKEYKSTLHCISIIVNKVQTALEQASQHIGQTLPYFSAGQLAFENASSIVGYVESANQVIDGVYQFGHQGMNKLVEAVSKSKYSQLRRVNLPVLETVDSMNRAILQDVADNEKYFQESLSGD